MFLGEGHKYMTQVSDALCESSQRGVLLQRPAVVNLQCDLDHPTQSLADLRHLVPHLRRPRRAAGQEARHDLGLLAELRQAAVGAAGHRFADDPVRHGRRAGAPGGLRPGGRAARRGAALRGSERRLVLGRGLHGGRVPRRRRRLSQELGAGARDARAHAAPARGRDRQARRPRARGAREQRAVQELGVQRGPDARHQGRAGGSTCTACRPT